MKAGSALLFVAALTGAALVIVAGCTKLDWHPLRLAIHARRSSLHARLEVLAGSALLLGFIGGRGLVWLLALQILLYVCYTGYLINRVREYGFQATCACGFSNASARLGLVRNALVIAASVAALVGDISITAAARVCLLPLAFVIVICTTQVPVLLARHDETLRWSP